MNKAEYVREMLIVLRDEHIKCEQDFIHVLGRRKIEVGKNFIRIHGNIEAGFYICTKVSQHDNTIVYVKITSLIKHNIESISDEITSCINNENFKLHDKSESAKIRILNCDISRENATLAYPCIYETENLFRKFISLSCYPTQPRGWFELHAPKDILDKIERRSKENHHDSNIWDTDFDDSIQVLTKAKSPEDLINRLSQNVTKLKKAFKIENISLVDSLIPKSLWNKLSLEKYITDQQSFEVKWNKLSVLRNKIAHNQVINSSDLKEIEGLSKAINKALEQAIDQINWCNKEIEDIKVDETRKNELIIENEEALIESFNDTNDLALTNLDPEEISKLNYWFFNTNESYAEGLYSVLFREGYIAIYGYGNANKFSGAKEGERVLAYVNRKGLMAAGHIEKSEVSKCGSIFEEVLGYEPEDGFCIKVQWDGIINEEKSISFSEATRLGYPLPVRSTFCKLYDTETAEKFYSIILERSATTVGF